MNPIPSTSKAPQNAWKTSSLTNTNPQRHNVVEERSFSSIVKNQRETNENNIMESKILLECRKMVKECFSEFFTGVTECLKKLFKSFKLDSFTSDTIKNIITKQCKMFNPHIAEERSELETDDETEQGILSSDIELRSSRKTKKKNKKKRKKSEEISGRSSLERSCNCLLYTSPSPRDKRQSRMPSSA